MCILSIVSPLHYWFRVRYFTKILFSTVVTLQILFRSFFPFILFIYSDVEVHVHCVWYSNKFVADVYFVFWLFRFFIFCWFGNFVYNIHIAVTQLLVKSKSVFTANWEFSCSECVFLVFFFIFLFGTSAETWFFNRSHLMFHYRTFNSH